MNTFKNNKDHLKFMRNHTFPYSFRVTVVSLLIKHRSFAFAKQDTGRRPAPAMIIQLVLCRFLFDPRLPRWRRFATGAPLPGGKPDIPENIFLTAIYRRILFKRQPYLLSLSSPPGRPAKRAAKINFVCFSLVELRLEHEFWLTSYQRVSP